MNILFFLRKFPIYGGVERMTINLASILNQKGYNIYIISQKGEADELLSELSSNIKLFFLPNEKQFLSACNINYFIQIITCYNIDCIINQGCYVDVNKFLQRLSSQIKKPIFSVLHNDPLAPIKDIKRNIEIKNWKSILKKLFFPIYKSRIKYLTQNNYKHICAFSDKIILLSKSFIKDFKQYSHCPDSKLIVIPNGVPFTTSSIQIPKEKIIIYVGRVIEQQKRISRLINIWEQIQSPEWKIQIIGDGKDLELYKKIVEQKHIVNIDFLGYKKNIFDYMKKASIISLVSDFEGFPMVLIEAMHEQCIPICYGSFSAINDIIENKINGYIIPPFNEQDYIKQLKALMNNQEMREKLSDKAYEKSLTYSIDQIVPLWENILSTAKGK